MAEENSMWHYIRSYKFKSIFAGYFCLILCIVLIPLFAIGTAVFHYNNMVIKDEIGNAYKKSLYTAKEMLDIIVDEIDGVTMRILYDSSVERFMAQDIDRDYSGYERVRVIADAVNSISVLESEFIRSVELYSVINDTVLSSEDGLSSVPEKEYGGDLNRFQSQNGANKWVAAREGDGAQSRVISFFYTVPLLSQEKRGVIVLNVSVVGLQKRIDEGDWNSGEEFLIVDETDTVLFSSGQAVSPGTGLAQILPGGREGWAENTFVKTEEDGAEVFVSEVASKHNGWRYVSMIPMEEYTQKINMLRNWFILAVLIVFPIIAFFAFGLAVRIYMPIRDIVSTVENPEKMRDKLPSSENEYRYIIEKYLKIVDKKNMAEEELQRRVDMLRQAQIVALQTQIHPHFLYNTLQAISWMAIGLTKDENNVSRAIKSLSDLLHATLETDNYLVSLGDEVRYARKYLEIQNIRYRNKFDVVWDVEPDLYDCAVAKLTLQPLLENALGHSIKYLKQKGTVWVCAHSCGEWIRLEVRDNGVGMEEEAVRKLNEAFRSEYMSGGRHIGLRNVNQRIRLIFGTQSTLQIERPEKGLNVKILIPKVKKVCQKPEEV